MQKKLLIVPAILSVALAACGDDKQTQQTESAAAPAPTAPAVEPNPAPAPAPIVPGGVVSKEELAESVCFFTPEEVQAALGFAVLEGKPDTKNLASYGSASCRYEGKDNVLHINVFWLDPSQIAAARNSQTKIHAGNHEPLPGDPDGAYLQYQQELGGALHYIRRNVMIEVRPMSWRDDNATMKANLLKLRRVP